MKEDRGFRLGRQRVVAQRGRAVLLFQPGEVGLKLPVAIGVGEGHKGHEFWVSLDPEGQCELAVLGLVGGSVTKPLPAGIPGRLKVGSPVGTLGEGNAGRDGHHALAEQFGLLVQVSGDPTKSKIELTGQLLA